MRFNLSDDERSLLGPLMPSERAPMPKMLLIPSGGAATNAVVLLAHRVVAMRLTASTRDAKLFPHNTVACRIARVLARWPAPPPLRPACARQALPVAVLDQDGIHARPTQVVPTVSLEVAGAGEGKPPLRTLGFDITADFSATLRGLVAGFVVFR
jgi:hypothetical protein